MYLIDDAGTKGVACSEVGLLEMKTATGGLAGKILALLANSPSGIHSSAIAKTLGLHEQNIYYHTRRLRAAGIIVVHHTEDGRGGTAKMLALRHGAFAVRMVPMSSIAHIGVHSMQHVRFLSPFIADGVLDCRIVVGSPDPHGPEQARSRDANYAVDLGLFLGGYLRTMAGPSVVLDTELRDWNQNLIIIGGPVVNKAAERINIKSPARYDRELKSFVIGKKLFGEENVGVIVKMQNPYARGKWILHISGKRHTGTRAAIIALMNTFDEICKHDMTVVEGMDNDSDGIVDSARIVFVK